MDWKTIPSWPRYEVSTSGMIRNIASGQLIRQRVRKVGKGYVAVDLYGPPGTRTTVGVHILVCTTFHGPRPSPRHEAAHGDGNRANNYKCNLRWATRLENAEDKRKHDTMVRGERCNFAKLNASQVQAILRDSRSNAAIAISFGVDRRTVGKIKAGKRWAHLTGSGGNPAIPNILDPISPP